MLDPCAISMTRSVSEDRQETVAVDFTDVCFHISPRVVNVMLGVSNALSSVTQVNKSRRDSFAFFFAYMKTLKQN